MVSHATVALVTSIILPVSVLATVLWLFYLREREHDRKSMDIKRKFRDLRGQLKKLDHRATRSRDEVISKQQFDRAAFELQSRLFTQVVRGGGNWLHEQKVKEGKEAYDYAKVFTLYLFCRFFYWSHYVVESALLVGLENATELYSLIDGIYFQITGQTSIQGCKGEGVLNPDEHDAHADIFFIKIMTIQAIAAAMCNESGSCVSVNEFYELLKPGPSPGEGVAAGTEKTRKVTFQEIISPLDSQIDVLATLEPNAKNIEDRPPARRMVILQVLLCKLVDLSDAGQPWDAGPLFDADEDPRMFKRNLRLIPMLNKVTAPQRAWLKEQIFFRDDPELQFPGFREDLLTATAEGRSNALEGFPPGVFPPAVPRRRDSEWLQKHMSTQGPVARNTLLRRQKPQRIEAQDAKAGLVQQPGLVPKQPLLTAAPSYDVPRNVERNQVVSNRGLLAVGGSQGMEQAAAHETEISTGAIARGSEAATQPMAAAAQAHLQLQGQGPGQGHVIVYALEPYGAASSTAVGAHTYPPGNSMGAGQLEEQSTSSVASYLSPPLSHVAAHSRSSREGASSRGAGIGSVPVVNHAGTIGIPLPGQYSSSDGMSNTLQISKAEAQVRAKAAQAAMLQPTAQAPSVVAEPGQHGLAERP